MEIQDKVRELTDEIVEDFKSTSGYGSEDQTGSDDSFDLHMDPTPLITMVVSPMVEQILNLIGKKIAERKPKTPPRLTEQEITEIRKIVVSYSARTSLHGVLTSEEAARMADSVERVLRKNPRALLG